MQKGSVRKAAPLIPESFAASSAGGGMSRHFASHAEIRHAVVNHAMWLCLTWEAGFAPRGVAKTEKVQRAGDLNESCMFHRRKALDSCAMI